MYAVGEEVNVVMSQSQGFRAFFLGYLLPFLIIMFILITLTALGVKELLAGINCARISPSLLSDNISVKGPE